MTITAKERIKTMLGRVSGNAGMYDRAFRSKLLIVTFHRINDDIPEDGLTCSSAKFEGFCQFFLEHFRVVPLSEQVAGCRERRDMGGTVSITFDDGYRDNFEVAAPILRKYKLPATFFLATDFIATDRAAPWDHVLTRRLEWMDWDDVRQLHREGHAIGAHTMSHIDLGKESPETVRAELTGSRRKLERELGAPISLFAYPFGGRHNISPTSLRLVKEAGFECCLGCHGGVNSPVADPFQLNRISIAEWFATPHQFGFELMAGRVNPFGAG
jgi:peptidoglycan/xylan/chitin deacetylase (PgdA/CDA1 family)